MEPPTRVLSDRILMNQARHLGSLVREGHELVENPSEGSPAKSDRDYIDRHPERDNLSGLAWWAHSAAVYNLTAAEEHLTGLGLLISSERLLPLPAMALARSIYEAVINTCWLIDADASTEQRLARWACRLLHDGQEPSAALESFGPDVTSLADRERAAEARALGQQLMLRAGFDLKAKRGDKAEDTASVTFAGERSGLTPNVTQLVDRFTPSTNLWHLFSGATHSRGWLISGLAGTASDLLPAVVAPLLDTSDALVVEVCRYFDLNPRPTIKRTHLHRAAILRHARAHDGVSVNIDAYRKASGLPPLP